MRVWAAPRLALTRRLADDSMAPNLAEAAGGSWARVAVATPRPTSAGHGRTRERAGREPSPARLLRLPNHSVGVTSSFGTAAFIRSAKYSAGLA